MWEQSKQAAQRIISPSLTFCVEVLKYDFKSIVDFGCGYGLHVEYFAKAGKRATGIDLGIGAEALADARAGGYELVQGSWSDLEPEGYDAGFSHHCLEHARDPIGWLHEWGKAVKPNGKLFLVVPACTATSSAGHIANGWNVGQVIYNLAVAGWDCRNGRFKKEGGAVWAIADRPAEMILYDHVVEGWGQAKEFMPDMQFDGLHFRGDVPAVNW